MNGAGQIWILLGSQRRYRCSRCPAIAKEKAYKAHSSQARHRLLSPPHKWAPEAQFTLIVVIVSD